MKRLVCTSLLLVLFINAFLQSEIYEIAHFEEIYNHLQPETLIVYDIDDTLFSMNQHLGSDHWLDSQFKRHQKEGMAPRAAFEKAINEWRAVQHLSGCKPVEPINPEVVEYTQKHYTVIALTSRGHEVATRTVELLRDSGFNLSLNPLTQDALLFMQENENILFHKGILFTSGRHKGECLEKLLNAVGVMPKRVLFVNDKRAHILPVEDFCVRAGIEFTGLRYGFVDERRDAFDSAVSDIQWAHFGNILSDEEAETIMQGICIDKTSP